MQIPATRRAEMVRNACAGLLLCIAGTVCNAAPESQQQPSLWDQAIDGTVHTVKRIDAALSRAADKTGQWLTSRQVPQKVRHAAERTDAALHRAAGKVLPKDAPQAPPKNAEPKPAR